MVGSAAALSGKGIVKVIYKISGIGRIFLRSIAHRGFPCHIADIPVAAGLTALIVGNHHCDRKVRYLAEVCISRSIYRDSTLISRNGSYRSVRFAAFGILVNKRIGVSRRRNIALLKPTFGVAVAGRKSEMISCGCRICIKNIVAGAAGNHIVAGSPVAACHLRYGGRGISRTAYVALAAVLVAERRKTGISGVLRIVQSVAVAGIFINDRMEAGHPAYLRVKRACLNSQQNACRDHVGLINICIGVGFLRNAVCCIGERESPLNIASGGAARKRGRSTACDIDHAAARNRRV